MVFSSPVFLFLFLPLVLGLYFGLGPCLRNVILLLTSLIFYAWGEQFFVLMMLASIAGNYVIGLWVHKLNGTPRVGRLVGLAVVFNIGLLVAFKYGSFLLDTALNLGRPLGLPAVELQAGHLPIGISFFTFQALSYVLDVRRGHAPVQRNPLDLALYISLFPQLIAGPIVRYGQIATQLSRRHVDLEGLAEGVRRFVIGLGKKVLIANTVALLTVLSAHW